MFYNLKIKIHNEWHAGDLHNELMKESNQIIKDTIIKIFTKNNIQKKQTENTDEKSKHAPKILKKDFILDWSIYREKSLYETYNFIRGMSPPGVKTSIHIRKKNNQANKNNIIITQVGNYQKNNTKELNKCREISIEANNNEIKIYKSSESFCIKRLKTENGKEISSKEFINGFLKNTNS